MERTEAQRLVDRHTRWFQKFEVFPGIMTPGVHDPSGILSALALPEHMDGKTVLDIGAADGFFTKTLDSRGANVIAMDYAAKDFYGFAVTEALHGRALRHVNANLYDVEKQGFQPFDYVLCFGVLYHLPDMLRALWAIRPYVKGELFLETYVSRKHEDEPVAEYLPNFSCNNDYTNFWAPNPLCVKEMLMDAGFSIADSTVSGERALFRATPNLDKYATKKISVAYSFLEP